MPLTPDQVSELEYKQSSYGCGARVCADCYPIQYACAECEVRWDSPIAYNETYQCPNCDWVNNERED